MCVERWFAQINLAKILKRTSVFLQPEFRWASAKISLNFLQNEKRERERENVFCSLTEREDEVNQNRTIFAEKFSVAVPWRNFSKRDWSVTGSRSEGDGQEWGHVDFRCVDKCRIELFHRCRSPSFRIRARIAPPNLHGRHDRISIYTIYSPHLNPQSGTSSGLSKYNHVRQYPCEQTLIRWLNKLVWFVSMRIIQLRDSYQLTLFTR